MLGEPDLRHIGSNPELTRILVTHAYRGVQVQLVLRALLVLFLAFTLGFVPPDHDGLACAGVVAAYAVFVVATAAWSHRGGLGPVRWMWLTLLVDAAVISAVTLMAGLVSAQSWTADVLINGFYVVPMLAATHLRPRVCLLVVAPTTAAYLAVSIATKDANAEPWTSLVLRTVVIAGLGVACVALSRVQLSRVLTIAGLARQRAELLTELVAIEARERSELAEHLHDGALQYLLAARQDLDDARETGDADAFDRVERALAESTQLLRSTVSELHPAVLAQAGLPRALTGLAAGVAERGRLAVDVQLDGWPDRPSAVDGLLYSAARELLGNVVKHSGARHAVIELGKGADERARLTVSDDGRGLPPELLATRLADGHIGLASQRARIAAAGGDLTIEPGEPSGTRVTVQLPMPAPVGS